MIIVWLLHSIQLYTTLRESVEQRKWCFKVLRFWATWTISEVHYAEALNWMRHLSWGMWRGNTGAGECYKLGDGLTWCLHFTLTDFCLLMRAFLQLINISTEFLVMETQIMKTGLTQRNTTLHNWDDSLFSFQSEILRVKFKLFKIRISNQY